MELNDLSTGLSPVNKVLQQILLLTNKEKISKQKKELQKYEKIQGWFKLSDYAV